MSGLAHYLEDEGIPTVVIALVREHAQTMHPPRALWVPYMLGRPFGSPNDPAGQTLVLRQALALLEAESGPVLVDADVPGDDEMEQVAWVCPVSFKVTGADNAGLGARVCEEISELRSWYDLGVERRGRTTVGLSPMPLDEAATLIARYIRNPVTGDGSDPSSVADSLRWSATDLKTYYWESATAQPGEYRADQLEAWFWKTTAAGEMLQQLRDICLDEDAEEIRDVGRFMIGVPA